MLFSWRGIAATSVVGLLLSASATALAQLPVAVDPGVIGYVLGPEGTPVSSGTVVIQSDFTRTTGSIDRTGRFRVVPLRAGFHQVLVSVSGLAPYRMTVTVPASRFLRLPVIRLAPAAYFRVRFVTPAGEPINTPPLLRRSFDASGNPIPDAPTERISDPADNDGAVLIGPLPRGITTLAVDHPVFARTRLPDLNFDGVAKIVEGGTVVLQQPGAVLDVDILDGAGAPVPAHEVHLEDALPRSPLVFRPVRTNQQGRATFDRLAAGRYRVWTPAVERCGSNQIVLTASRDLSLSGTGTVETRLIVGGRATFHVTTPLGPARGVLITASPNTQASPSPFGTLGASSGCRGTTDADGRVMLMNFPPGPAHVDVHTGNSTYTRQVDVPSNGQEMAVVVPDGFLPVRVVNARTGQAVAGASIIWTGGGARIEAAATTTGEALLEGVGTSAGTLVVSARGYQTAEESLPEPPGFLHEFALTPVAADSNLRPHVITTSGAPVPNAVVELISANPAAVPHVAVTDAKGFASFFDVPPGSLQLFASADGYIMLSMRIGEARPGGIMFTLSPGFRVIADVELPATEGPQVVRMMNTANASMENALDSASDRGFEPPGRLSLGPLPPGAYVIELYGASGRRQERIQIVDRDVYTKLP